MSTPIEFQGGASFVGFSFQVQIGVYVQVELPTDKLGLTFALAYRISAFLLYTYRQD